MNLKLAMESISHRKIVHIIYRKYTKISVEIDLERYFLAETPENV